MGCAWTGLVLLIVLGLCCAGRARMFGEVYPADRARMEFRVTGGAGVEGERFSRKDAPSDEVAPVPCFEGSNYITDFALSPVADVIAIVGSTRITVRSTGNWSQLTRFDDSGYSKAVFSFNGEFLAAANRDRVLVWETRGWTPVYADVADAMPMVRSAVFSPSARFLAMTSVNGVVVHDLFLRKKVADIAHPDLVRSAAFSDDEKVLVTGCDDGAVRAWDVATWASVSSHTVGVGFVKHVAFGADGRLYVGQRASTKILDIRTGETETLPHHGSVFEAMTTPDRKHVLRDASDSVEILDTATGAVTRVESGCVMEYGLRGGVLFTRPCGRSTEIQTFDVASGKPTCTLPKKTPPDYASMYRVPHATPTGGGEQGCPAVDIRLPIEMRAGFEVSALASISVRQGWHVIGTKSGRLVVWDRAANKVRCATDDHFFRHGVDSVAVHDNEASVVADGRIFFVDLGRCLRCRGAGVDDEDVFRM